MKLDTLHISIFENFYPGIYYNAIGDRAKAREHLFIPAMSPYDNAYKQEAHQLYNNLS